MQTEMERQMRERQEDNQNELDQVKSKVESAEIQNANQQTQIISLNAQLNGKDQQIEELKKQLAHA